MLRQTRAAHLGGIGARGMQDGAAGAVDPSRIVAIEDADIFGIELRSLVEVGQSFPAAANAQHLIIHVRRLIDDALDDGVQAGNISTAG